MSRSTSLVTLSPQQLHKIDARAGLRLDVLFGCLWLTRPGDERDRFVHAGASIELHQDGVLIECHWPRGAHPLAAQYRLLPVRAAAASGEPCRPGPATRWRWFGMRSA